MSVTPTGFLSIGKAHLQEMIARSAAWQAALDVDPDDSAPERIAEARERIHLVALPDFDSGIEEGGANPRPFWLIAGPDEFSLTNNNEYYQDQGQVWALFEWAVPSTLEPAPADAETTFTNLVGAILADVLALSGTGVSPVGSTTYPVFDRVEMRVTPRRSDQGQGEAADYYQIILLFAY